MSRCRVHSTLAALVGLLISEHSLAQEQQPAGDASNALPGLHRVPVLGSLEAPRLSTAFDAGYGYTESLGGGRHHRASGSLALGIAPLPGLEFAMSSGLRRDWHAQDQLGSDTGTLGHGSFLARFGQRYGRAFWLGTDLGVHFAGFDKLLDSLERPSLDLRAAMGWLPANAASYAGFVGYRYDRSAASTRAPATYRMGDRVALGQSDYDAVLVGVGVLVPLSRYELFGEVTGDLLIGKGAPPIYQSPLRFDLALRRALSERWRVEIRTEVSLSKRPDLATETTFIPIEPRFFVGCGIRYAFELGSGVRPSRHARHQDDLGPEQKPTDTMVIGKSPSATRAVEPTTVPTGRVVVTIVDSDGHPLSDATATVTHDAGEVPLKFQQGSTFVADSVPTGRSALVIRADLMREFRQTIEVERERPLELRVEMKAAELSGQLRGQVRAFDGTGLRALVRIHPGGREIHADPQGRFKLDVTPGKYSIKVSLPGYKTQQQTVKVHKSGVMVLNVDLERERR